MNDQESWQFAGEPSECPLCRAPADRKHTSVNDAAICPVCGFPIGTTAQLVSDTIRIFEQVLQTEPGVVTPDSCFSDQDIDSLETIELVMGLEEEFAVSIPPEFATPETSIRDLARFVLKQKSE